MDEKERKLLLQILKDRYFDDRPFCHITAEYEDARDANRQSGNHADTAERRYRLQKAANNQ